MPGQFPYELILPSRFRGVVSCVEDVLIVLLNLAMAVLNDVRNACHDYSECREALHVLKVNSIGSDKRSFETLDGSQERHGCRKRPEL
jgi:hypothetical protein